jgi:hypothetical protein
MKMGSWKGSNLVRSHPRARAQCRSEEESSEKKLSIPRYKAGSFLSLLSYLDPYPCHVAHGAGSQSCLTSKVTYYPTDYYQLCSGHSSNRDLVLFGVTSIEVLLRQSITMARTEKNTTDYYRWGQ